MKKISFLSLFVMLLTLGFSSCSSITGENELTNYIPANAPMVMKLDCKKLFEAADVKVDGDKVELPAYMKDMFKGENAEMLAKINSKIDLENVYAVKCDGDYFFLLAGCKDYPGLTAMLEDEKLVKSAQDEYEIYGFGDDSALGIYKEKYVYLMSGCGKVDDFKTLVETIRKNPLAKYDALADAVSTADAVSFVMNYEAYFNALPSRERALIGGTPEYIKGKFMGANINFDGNKMLFDGGMGNIDGSPFKPMATMDDINIALLAYVPENYNIIVAAGKPNLNDPDYYDQLAKNMGRAGGFIADLIPYLKSVDGSSLAAFRVSPEIMGGFNPEYFDVMLMAHMPMEKIREAISNLMTFGGMHGLPSVEVSEDMYMINLPGISVYFGAADGYLVISTQPVSATHNSELTKYFVNKKSAAVVDGNCLKGMLPFYPFAVMQSNDGAEFKADVTLEGTSEKFIPALMQLMK
ncbi:MAG: DUF4836 family protein [Duncaniella sp.]|nr:DUF4836 family protein [Duncaniella sp.]